MSDEGAFIEFTPHAPDAAPRPAAPEPARPTALTYRLPPEALGRWAEPPASSPAAAPPPVTAPRRARIGAPGAASRVPHAPNRGAPAPNRHEARTGYQEEWLNRRRHARALVELTCMGGGTITGRIVNFDLYALVMEVDGRSMLVFKHALVCVRCAGDPDPPRGT